MNSDDDLIPHDEEELAGPVRAKAEKWLDGDPDDHEAVAGGFSDEGLEPEVTEDEIRAAEAIDLASMRGFERDAFEDWIKLTEDLQRRYGRTQLTALEMEKELVKAHSSDPEIADKAEDKLVRWNVKWIVKCLHQYAGSTIMSRPGPLREDLLSSGRWGFLTAIRKYNDEQASRNGYKKASLLTFSDQWIRKYVSEILLKDHYGLNEDAALARKKIIAARNYIREKTGGEASIEQIVRLLDTRAREKLAQAGIDSPDRKQLRQKGAMAAARVKELLDHDTQHTSIDAPTGDDDGPTIGERVGAGDDVIASMEQEEQISGLVEQVRRIPRHRHRRAFEMLNGLPIGHGRLDLFSRAETAVFLGRTVDSVISYAEHVKRDVRGEASVEREQVDWTIDGSTVPKSILNDMARQVDLRRVVASEGIRVDLRQEEQVVECPFDGGDMKVTPREYCCEGCGQKGNIFSWLVERRGLTRSKAIVEAGRMAVRLPRQDMDAIMVTVDKGRQERIRALR